MLDLVVTMVSSTTVRRVSRSTTREDLSEVHLPVVADGGRPLAADSHEGTLPAAAPTGRDITTSDVQRLVEAGAPFDELVNMALVQANKQAVREGGGIAPIVSMLTIGEEERDGAGTSEAAVKRTSSVVSALWSLAAHNTANQDAIRLADGVPRLVAQLDCNCRPEAPELAGHAAGALWSLAANNTCNQDAVREAGGVGRLIALLEASITTCPEAARHAAVSRPTSPHPLRAHCLCRASELPRPFASARDEPAAR